MAKLQPVRGTHDLLPDEMRRHQHIIRVFSNLVESYGFGQIETPIFEFTEVWSVFLRSAATIQVLSYISGCSKIFEN